MTESKNITSREELINRIADDWNEDGNKPNQKQIREVINRFLEEVNNALIGGEEVRLIGSFTLLTDFRKEKQGRNPRTSESITIPAQWIPKCKFSSKLKEEIAKRKK